jgi:hypothetical protein
MNDAHRMSGYRKETLTTAPTGGELSPDFLALARAMISAILLRPGDDARPLMLSMRSAIAESGNRVLWGGLFEESNVDLCQASTARLHSLLTAMSTDTCVFVTGNCLL